MSLSLHGPLTFDTVPKISEKFFSQIRQAVDSASLSVDLSAVSRVDSAGLAMMVEGASLAKSMGYRLNYRACNESLYQFVSFCRLTEILGMSFG